MQSTIEGVALSQLTDVNVNTKTIADESLLVFDKNTKKFVARSNPLTTDVAAALAAAASPSATVPYLTRAGAVFKQTGNYRDEIAFLNAGALAAGQWSITGQTIGTSLHDNIHAIKYNLKYNQTTFAHERILEGEHCVQVSYESRYTTADPTTVRGAFEWNIDIDPLTTGTPFAVAGKRPWSFYYQMDATTPRRADLIFGDAGDTLNRIRMQGAYLSFKNTISSDSFTSNNSVAIDINGTTFDPVADGGYAMPIVMRNVVFGTGSKNIGVFGLYLDGATWTKPVGVTAAEVHTLLINTPAIGNKKSAISIDARPASGTYSIYNASTADNYFAGHLKFATGKGIFVNAVQVIGNQGAAVADATGAGDVVAQLNALLARVRAHGLIAT